MYQPVLTKGIWQNDIRLCIVTSNVPVIFTAFRVKILNTPLFEKLGLKNFKSIFLILFYKMESNYDFQIL